MIFRIRFFVYIHFWVFPLVYIGFLLRTKAYLGRCFITKENLHSTRLRVAKKDDRGPLHEERFIEQVDNSSDAGAYLPVFCAIPLMSFGYRHILVPPKICRCVWG